MTSEQPSDPHADDGLIEATNNAGEPGQPEQDQTPASVVVGDSVEGAPVPDDDTADPTAGDPVYLDSLGVAQGEVQS